MSLSGDISGKTISVGGKGSEITAVRDLLDSPEITDCMIVADALSCQRDTVKKVISGGADYLLPVKGNSALSAQLITLTQRINKTNADTKLGDGTSGKGSKLA